MATVELNELKSLIPYMLKHKNMWSSYDEEVDVLYLHFKKPNHSDESELTADDTIIRYENGEVVGITILNASQNQRVQ